MLRLPLILGAMALALSPAIAQDAPVCPSPIDKIVAQVVEGGGEFLNLVDIPGKEVDQMMVLRMGNAIVVGMVSEGCVVSAPIALVEAQFAKPAVGI